MIVFIIIALVILAAGLFFYLLSDDEPGEQPRKHRTRGTTTRRESTGEPQGQEVERPDRKPPKDDGMNPQQRTIPYITPEPKPDEQKEQEPKIKPFKYRPPKVDLTPPKRKDRGKGDDSRGI